MRSKSDSDAGHRHRLGGLPAARRLAGHRRASCRSPRANRSGDSSEIAVDPAAKAMATTRATAATISAAERQGDLGATRNVDALVPIVPVTTRRLPVLRPVPDRRSRTTAPTTPSASTVGRRILHWPDNDRRSLPSGALEDRLFTRMARLCRTLERRQALTHPWRIVSDELLLIDSAASQSHKWQQTPMPLRDRTQDVPLSQSVRDQRRHSFRIGG